MMNDKPLALVDLDGTIVNPYRRLHGLFVKLSGSSISFEEYISCKKEGLLMNDMLELCRVPRDEWGNFKKNWLKNVELQKWLEIDTLYDGADDFLKNLSVRFNVALWTNRQNKRNLIWQLKRLGIYELFTEIMVSENRYSKAELVSGTKNIDSAIAIGDAEEDKKAAEEYGLSFFCVERFVDKQDYNKLEHQIFL